MKKVGLKYFSEFGRIFTNESQEGSFRRRPRGFRNKNLGKHYRGGLYQSPANESPVFSSKPITAGLYHSSPGSGQETRHVSAHVSSSFDSSPVVSAPVEYTGHSDSSLLPQPHSSFVSFNNNHPVLSSVSGQRMGKPLKNISFKNFQATITTTQCSPQTILPLPCLVCLPWIPPPTPPDLSPWLILLRPHPGPAGQLQSQSISLPRPQPSLLLPRLNSLCLDTNWRLRS